MKEKELLQVLQEGLPLESRPFKKIAQQLGISEEEVISTLKELKNKGVIRYIGASVDTRRLGYFTCLCAVSLPEEKVHVAYEIAELPEVTHAYLRKHKFNFWFTTVTKDKNALFELVKSLENKFGVKIFLFPSVKKFKVKAVFKL
ncbi:MAG: Lrp/AsnC family transcriptional regulator [Thermodesulfobacteria bacterium]|nr:Lrp/AsnC family transcriptional regulator [Thermodesulfobacteriota bacterium]